MIRTLRLRHRRVILLLAIALPLLVAAALSARRPIPRMERLPDGLTGSVADVPPVGTPRVASWDGGSLRATLLRGVDGAGTRVSIELLQELVRPDLLVYWSDDTDAVFEGVPDDAALLGRLAGRYPIVFELPVQAAGSDGQLILVSPSQDEIVTSFRLPAGVASAAGDPE